MSLSKQEILERRLALITEERDVLTQMMGNTTEVATPLPAPTPTPVAAYTSAKASAVHIPAVVQKEFILEFLTTHVGREYTVGAMVRSSPWSNVKVYGTKATTFRKVAQELTVEGKVIGVGTGAKSDPYRFYVARSA